MDRRQPGYRDTKILKRNLAAEIRGAEVIEVSTPEMQDLIAASDLLAQQKEVLLYLEAAGEDRAEEIPGQKEAIAETLNSILEIIQRIGKAIMKAGSFQSAQVELIAEAHAFYSKELEKLKGSERAIDYSGISSLDDLEDEEDRYAELLEQDADALNPYRDKGELEQGDYSVVWNATLLRVDHQERLDHVRERIAEVKETAVPA